MTLSCEGFMVLLSYNRCLQEKLCYILPIYSLLTTIKGITRQYINNLKTNMTKYFLGLEVTLKTS